MYPSSFLQQKNIDVTLKLYYSYPCHISYIRNVTYEKNLQLTSTKIEIIAK